MQRLTNDFVFSNQPRQRLARHGLFWLSWVLFFAFTYGFLPFGSLLQRGFNWPVALFWGFSIAFVDAVLFMPAHMFLAYIIMYWVIPRFLLKGQYGLALVNVILALLSTAVLSACLTKFIVDPIRICMDIGGRPSGNSFFFALMAGLRGATTIGGFAAAIKLVKIWYLKQLAYQQIDREKLQAELQLLKSQVHPHFLFNTLNNLYGLTLHKSDHSPAVVLKLSELLSYMLYDCNASEVTLQKEIEFMRNYIGLEQLRYGDRLDVSVNLSGDYTNKLIAPLLLVPFLENAFKHGTSEQLEQAWMHIDLSVHGTLLKFKVINSREADPHNGTPIGGIGLQNVKKRLQLLYPDRHELRIAAEDETFMISLTLELLPIQTAVRLPTTQLTEVV
ncbi:sensor histidine kinase [Spirosoma sp. KNUC1025]|uniref:sensor histidine kinase n=1 Tax=Spirosoma sp. KNUC1025 TaxID=2894082 RepID=UPI003863435B|nr:histidine kinase [Spirosoma sp. KNUC1025]